MIIILVYTFKVYSAANTACLIVYNNACKSFLKLQILPEVIM